MSLFQKIASKIPAPAAAKHLAESATAAVQATMSRKHIPPVNTVINPTTHYTSGGHHHVGGRTWNVMPGPASPTNKGFVMLRDMGYQLNKFTVGGVGHRVGDSNALALYRPRSTALTVRNNSNAPGNFPKL